MSKLEVGSHNLAPVTYQALLEAISHTLKNSGSSLRITPSGIFFDLDTIANRVASQFATSNRYPYEQREGMIYASIHAIDIEEKTAFSDQVESLVVKELQDLLLKALQEQKYGSIEQYIQSLLKPIAEYSNARIDAGIKYPLTKAVELEKQRLHLRPRKTTDTPWLKGHKLTLHIKHIRSFHQQVIDSICAYLEQSKVEDEDVADTREALDEMAKKSSSPLGQLQDLVVKRSLARIQREAKVRYLAYLQQGMQDWKSAKKSEGMRLLGTLIKRLQLLDSYIRTGVDGQGIDYGHFQVTYQDTIFNYCDLFARADAFDSLPIITEVEGTLGETTDLIQGAKTFTFGLKLKLNGPVQVHVSST